LRRCLAFEPEYAEQPALAVNAWSGLHKACVERNHASESARVYGLALAALEERKKNRSGSDLAVTCAMLAEVHERAGNWEHGSEEADRALRLLSKGPDRVLLRASMHAVVAKCELRAGAPERGLAAARRAADLLRSAAMPAARRNLAWHEFGELGAALWRWEQADLALDWMREAAQKLAAGGAADTAAACRIKIAAAELQLGRPEEVRSALPEEDTLSVPLRRRFLAVRAQLHLAERRGAEAASDSEELLASWLAEPDATAEAALTNSLLAKACLEAGAWEQADVLARKAAEVLEAWGHPEAASCHVTRGLARWRRMREWSAECAGDAVRLIKSDVFHTALEKQNLREAEAARLQRHGRPEEALDVRGIGEQEREIRTPELRPVLAV